MKRVSLALSLIATTVISLPRPTACAEEKAAQLLEVAQGLKISGKLGPGKTSATYRLRLLQGGTYIIEMMSPNPKALDPFLRLLDGKGDLVAADDDSGGGVNARLVFLAPATATYRVLATSFDGAGEGDFTLTITRDDARQADALEARVQFLSSAGKHAEALAVARELLKMRERQQGLGHWRTVNARWHVRNLEKAASLPMNAQTALAEAEKLNARGDELRGKGRYVEATPLYRKALDIRRQILGDEWPQTAIAWNNLAYCLNEDGKPADAFPIFEKALAIRRKILGQEHPDTATSYNNLAVSLNDQSKCAAATSFYEKALAIWRKTLGEEHADTARGYNGLAVNLDDQGKYAEAAPLYEKALAIWRKTQGEEHRDTATGYNNVAYNLNAQGKYAAAALPYEKALAINRHIHGEEHPDTALSYNNLAHNLRAQGRYAEAAPLFEKALAIHRSLYGEKHARTTASLNNLGYNLNAQGRHAEAAVVYEKVLAIRRRTLGEQHRDTAASYNNLAGALHAQGKSAEAAPLLESALAIFRKVLGAEHHYTATGYNNLASNLDARGKYADAWPVYEKALAIRRKSLGEQHPDTVRSYANLGQNLYRQGKYAAAAPLFDKALAVRRKNLGEEHPDTTRSYNNVAANLYAQGRYDAAQAMFTAAARSFAAARLRVSHSGLERVGFTDISPLPHLAASLARAGKPADAWQYFEESLARGTGDDLAARLRRAPEDRAKQMDLVHRLARLDQLLDKTLLPRVNPDFKKRRPELLAERRQLHDQLAAFTAALEKKYGPAAGQVFDRTSIQKALPADTALVAWLDIEGQPKAADPNGDHWGIVLRAGGLPVWVRLRGSGTKDAWTRDDSALPGKLRDALRRDKTPWQEMAAALRKQRLAPLREYLRAGDGLPAVKHLVILPSTALAGVPVEVFAAEYTVSYALSGTLFAHLKQQPKPDSDGLLVLADPVFENDGVTRSGKDGNWSELPGTRFEADAVRKLFGDKNATLLTDSQASEQTLDAFARKGELDRFRYLHLATHAEADEQFPLRSAVILARDQLPDPFKQWQAGLPPYDGRLTAEEILGTWNLKADLVTLSACETALGKYAGGEGFVGFAQALILSGSRGVCLSLWKVDDTATALLMERFYQNLTTRSEGRKARGEKMTKAEALAEAKAWLRNLTQEEARKRIAALRGDVSRGAGRKRLPPLPPRPPNMPQRRQARPYAHPYYWAAFVLIGAET